MSILKRIDAAGAFPVKHVTVPHATKKVQWNLAPAGVLHTTEGGWQGSLDVFKVHFAPHFMLGYNEHDKKAEIIQLVDVGLEGLATRAHDDMVRVQIEMIGYAEETPWLPGSTAKNSHPETLDALCSLMNVCEKEWGIPLSHPWKDGDYGRAGNNPHRHAGFLGKVPGWFGHADLPFPDVHWDPGNLEYSKVFARAAALKAA